ncbi:MAG: hypothetical protein ACRENE_04205, partial [Polyangiaceae bacterium]
MRAIGIVTTVVAAVAVAAPPAVAAPTTLPADGVSVVRALGPHALEAFSPRGATGMGALVRLPAGVQAGDWGLRPAAPAIGRFWGSPSALVAFADAHPGARVEAMPPLRT